MLAELLGRSQSSLNSLYKTRLVHGLGRPVRGRLGERNSEHPTVLGNGSIRNIIGLVGTRSAKCPGGDKPATRRLTMRRQGLSSTIA